MHGNRGRLPASAVPLDIKNKIISLYINDFSGANFTHFCEIVESDFRIKISEQDEHPRRPKSKYAGEMIQMDASSFHWIEKEVWHLHVAIDDADGKIVGAYFDYQETLKGYYNVLHQILTNHGIPALFYTDRRTVFEYKRKKQTFRC